MAKRQTKKSKASTEVAEKPAKSPREKRPKQKPLPGMGPAKADPVLDPLVIEYYDKVIERIAVQKEEKDLKRRVEFIMEEKKLLFYEASDGTKAEYPPAERKLKVARESDGDNPLDTSDPADKEELTSENGMGQSDEFDDPKD